MSTPSSIIKICSGVRLTNDYQHTIWFNNRADQLSYFAGKVVKTFSAYTYIRKSWSIKVDATMEQARTWSYLYFKNGTGKTYFYFINNIEYINDNTVELFIEMDVMQTYLDDYILHECFVEREHAAIDTIGSNLVEESLEVGEHMVIDESSPLLSELCILVLASFDPMTTTPDHTNNILSAKYNGIYSGLGVYAVPMENWSGWGVKLNDISAKLDGIVTMWMYPKNLVILNDDEAWDDERICKRVKQAGSLFHICGRNDVLYGGYTPRNKKLLTYPYNFLYATNNNGTSAVYRYERFSTPSACTFQMCGALSPEGVVKMYPNGYKNASFNYEEGMTLGGFPTCAWNQDVYKLWLAQNQKQSNVALGVAGLTIAGGVASMIFSAGAGAIAGGGAVIHGASSIASILAQRSDMEIQPPQARGQQSGSLNVVAGCQNFIFQRKSIDTNQARILDEFFDMFGYQTNRVKKPNRNVRNHYTFTKTRGCHVSGNLCHEDLRKIESIFDNGVTFWYENGDLVGNYAESIRKDNYCSG